MLACKGILRSRQWGDARSAGGVWRKDLRSKAYSTHYTMSKNACSQGHFAKPSMGQTREARAAYAAKTCEARLTAPIILQFDVLCNSFVPFFPKFQKNSYFLPRLRRTKTATLFEILNICKQTEKTSTNRKISLTNLDFRAIVLYCIIIE